MPEVSVVVSLYNYAGVVTETLTSIAASEGVDYELIVVEDHATDDSRAVVQQFIDDHPDGADGAARQGRQRGSGRGPQRRLRATPAPRW